MRYVFQCLSCPENKTFSALQDAVDARDHHVVATRLMDPPHRGRVIRTGPLEEWDKPKGAK